LFRRNGLSIVIGAMFVALLVGQVLAGARLYNDEREQRGEPPIALGAYLASGHFLEATAENWESEFLQMAVYVFFTVWLVQRGSAESKSLDKPEEVDRDPRLARGKRLEEAPGPVRRGGIALALYEHSLSIAFFLLFLVSLAGHAYGGLRLHNEEALAHGEPVQDLSGYLSSSQFWFESLQNWQSEFLAILSMVVLSIFLRQRGSPESKPVDAPHSQTGSG
jgi:hypothetical protein